jgi:hypothetical protein
MNGDVPRGADGALHLYQTDLDELVLHVSAAVPAEIRQEVLPRSETNQAPIELRLVCQSVESRKRFSQVLAGDGVHEGKVTFRKKEWAGLAEIRALLLRTKQGTSAGFASDRGSALAWSRPFRLLFDEPPPHPGNHLNIQWESFGSSGDRWRRRNEGQLFALDTSRERPTLFLNRDFEGAYRVLNSDAPHGRTARARDVTSFMLVHSVWTSMVAIALAAVASCKAEGDNLTTEEILDELNQYQGGTLRDWAHYLYPESDASTALEQVVSAGGDMVRTADVMARLGNAIQTRFSTHVGFQKLWETLDTA